MHAFVMFADHSRDNAVHACTALSHLRIAPATTPYTHALLCRVCMFPTW